MEDMDMVMVMAKDITEDMAMAVEEGIVMVAVGITAVMVLMEGAIIMEVEEEGIVTVVEDITHMLIMVMAEDITLMLIMVMAEDIIHMVADMDNNTFSC